MPQLPLKIRKKLTRLYLHASVSGYAYMQSYPGGNTKRGKWVRKPTKTLYILVAPNQTVFMV